MKKPTSLLASLGALIALAALASSAHGQVLNLSQLIAGDNYNATEPGTTPANLGLGTSKTYDPVVKVDAENYFGEGTSNHYLEFYKARHVNYAFGLGENATEILRVSFDLIPRYFPADDIVTINDAGWLNLNFFAGTEANPTASSVAHRTSLHTWNATIRNAGNVSFGSLNEVAHFDFFFNNSADGILYLAPDGGTASLAAGMAAVWVNGTHFLDYNDLRVAGTEGRAVHTFQMGIDSNTTRSVSFDLDNVEIYSIPEPSTYALLFGGLALAGAFCLRRRRG